MAEEKLSFQAEVAKLLDIVVHSLYSNPEIFLRELISNASDACDKLRYQGLTEPALLEGDGTFVIRLLPDKANRTLTISDNGIGMNRQELIDNLGTIARSGTAAFLDQVKSEGKGALSQIGQFGVGFYSAFMVADKVEVISRKAGDQAGWLLALGRQGRFTISEQPDAKRGAEIRLHLREDKNEFLESYRLKTIVKTYSDHIALPVILVEDGKESTINSASAWPRHEQSWIGGHDPGSNPRSQTRPHAYVSTVLWMSAGGYPLTGPGGYNFGRVCGGENDSGAKSLANWWGDPGL